MEQRWKIVLNENGGTVHIDGNDVSETVESVEITAVAGCRTSVTLRLITDVQIELEATGEAVRYVP